MGTTEQIFTITREYIELNKLLKATGLCGTGGQAKMVIQDGLVTVNSRRETRVRRKIKEPMEVTYNGHTIKVIFKKDIL